MRFMEKYGRARQATDENIRRPSPLTHTHTQKHTQKYVILIAFPRQQWLRERV